MRSFENALRLDLYDEIDTLGDIKAGFEYSEEYTKKIAVLFDKMRGDRLHKYTKKATVIILVAAVILALIITGFAASFGREFITYISSERIEYTIMHKTKSKKMTDINSGYIPDGFILESEEKLKTSRSKNYASGDLYICIEKMGINSVLGFDKESGEPEEIVINSIKYMFYENPKLAHSTIVWNDGKYIFAIESNLNKDEILKIAKNTQ